MVCAFCLYIERLWRTVKYEEVYINDYRLANFFLRYNEHHQLSHLGYPTPATVFSQLLTFECFLRLVNVYTWRSAALEADVLEKPNV